MTRPQPPRERQDLVRLLDTLAKRWADDWTLTGIGEELELTREAVAGPIARARAHGDDRFGPRLKPQRALETDP